MLKNAKKYVILQNVGNIPHYLEKGGLHNVGISHNLINCFRSLLCFFPVCLGNIKTNFRVSI